MLRIIEITLTVLGTVLLLGVLAALGFRAMTADALIDRFEEAKAAAEVAGVATGNAATAVPVRTAPAVTDAEGATEPWRELLPPNQSDWSPARQRRYQPLNAADRLPLGVLRIPAIALEVPVIAGTDPLALESGVGWLEGTARPGTVGNAAIAGHRDSFFRRIGQLAPGDTLQVETLHGTLEYRVLGHTITMPDDVSVLLPSPGLSELTLISCYPFRYVGSAPQRYIVHAALVD